MRSNFHLKPLPQWYPDPNQIDLTAEYLYFFRGHYVWWFVGQQLGGQVPWVIRIWTLKIVMGTLRREPHKYLGEYREYQKHEKEAKVAKAKEAKEVGGKCKCELMMVVL